jgi:hypothetical protein
MDNAFLNFKIYNEAGKMPLKTQLFFFLIAAFLDVLAMAYWEPPKKGDMPIVFMLPFAITLLALCVYMPIQYIIARISPNTHHILQALGAYLLILFALFLILILAGEIDAQPPFSYFIADLFKSFSSKELCGFLNFPAAFYLLILSTIYLSLPPKIAQARISNILDDNI